MLHKTKGIVLHTIKFTETSIITKIYTESFGLQSFIINGIRTSGKSKASLFGPMNMLDLEIYRRENNNLQRVKEFRPVYIYKSLTVDVLKSSITLFLAEVLYKCIREEEANQDLYHFIESSFIALDESRKADSNFHLIFLLHLTKYLGFSPDNHLGSCEYFDLQEGKFINDLPAHNHVISAPYTTMVEKMLSGETDVKMSLTDRNYLLEKLLLYYRLHLHDFRKVSSHHVLHQVLEEISV